MDKFDEELNKSEGVAESAIKILEAATELFALNGFNAVSIKEISSKSGVNSALISYYFGGKKKLYEKVINTKAGVFISLQERILKQEVSPLEKLKAYVDAIAELQAEHPYYIHLIFRELLTPQTMFEGYVKKRLYKVHQFMAELVQEAIALGEITTTVAPTHVAFTLESIIMFFFMMRKHVQTLGNFTPGGEEEYLMQALNTYLSALKKDA